MIFPLHLGNVATSIMKPIAYTSDSMLEVKARLSKTYRGWQACKSCTAEHILRQLAFNSLTAGARNAWTHFNLGSKEPPTFKRVVIAFLDECIANLEGNRCPPAVLTKVKSPPPASKSNFKSTKSAHVHTVKSTGKPHNPQLCTFCKEEEHKNPSVPGVQGIRR